MGKNDHVIFGKECPQSGALIQKPVLFAARVFVHFDVYFLGSVFWSVFGLVFCSILGSVFWSVLGSVF
jgi:hypothetical protein